MQNYTEKEIFEKYSEGLIAKKELAKFLIENEKKEIEKELREIARKEFEADLEYEIMLLEEDKKMCKILNAMEEF